MLISYNWLVANYHKGITPNRKLIIRTWWMPVLPKDTEDKDYAAFLAWWRDVVLPEYYGSFRSSGQFTVEWCFHTLIDTFETFRSGIVLDIYAKQTHVVQYDVIVPLGSSFGWYFAARIPQLLPVPAVGLLYPMLTSMQDNRGVPEETNDDVSFLLNKWGLNKLYNLAHEDRQDFSDQLETQLPTQFLSSTPVFLAHWALDTCIHVSRSQEFFTELDSLTNCDYNIYLEMPKGNHWSSIKQTMTPEFVKWLNKIII